MTNRGWPPGSNPAMQQLQQAFDQGRATGRQEVDMGMQQAIVHVREEMERKVNQTAGGLRKLLDQRVAQFDDQLRNLATIAQSLKMSRGTHDDPGTIRLEDVPGRRVPFTMLTDIAIGADTTSTRTGTLTISMEGPFVAVRRIAIFQSAYEFQTQDPTTNEIASFVGRSFGRYRPIHSTNDIFDAMQSASQAGPWWLGAISNPGIALGTQLPNAALGLPSSQSSFRSMEFDGRIRVINAGSSFPRQNVAVPSAFWTEGLHGPYDLGALDFFERGETITIEVEPLHVNNPPAGNVDSISVFPQVAGGLNTGGWPFVDGQYDSHEGIGTPQAATLGSTAPNLPTVLADDSVTRLPNGILTIGFEGYRIIQPIGPAL